MEVCRAIGEELRKLLAERGDNPICERTLVEDLLRFEAEKAAAQGLILTASNTYDDWTVVLLRVKGSSEPCAGFEFLPETGAFRAVGSPCEGGG